MGAAGGAWSPVLVVSATEQEARHVDSRHEVLVTGIGKVAAAAALSRRLARSAELPSLVLNIGSAGALQPGLSGVHVASSVWNHDQSADLLATMGVHVEAWLPLDGGDGTRLATGDLFVADEGQRDLLAQRADLVDMEGFAVAWTSRLFGVPCRLVKHVSDSADIEALAWLDVVDRSARELAAWVERETQAAPGPVL